MAPWCVFAVVGVLMGCWLGGAGWMASLFGHGLKVTPADNCQDGCVCDGVCV